MNSQFLYCFLFLLCLFFIIFFCEFLHKKGLEIEYTRKLGHSLSVLLCLLIPVCFLSHWYILVLTICSFAILYVGERKHLLYFICSVNRKTIGTDLLPVSIGVTYYITIWWLQSTLFYSLSVLVLAISDPLACYFGKLYKSRILRNGKTIIGTMAFFLSSMIICSLILCFQQPIIKSIYIASCISIIASVVELMSPNGSDNLTIPLSVIVTLVLFYIIP